MATSPKRRQVIDLEPSRQRILDAALRLFAQHGYEGVSLQQIADAVGLHKATLFHHFEGKPELAQEVWAIVIRPLLAEVESLDLPAETDPTLTQAIDLAERLVDHFGERPYAARLLMRAMIAPGDTPFQIDPADEPHAVERILTILWNWVDRARRAGVIRQVNLRQTIFNLLGVMLFYSAAAHGLPELAGADPFSPAARRAWKRDLGEFIRGALAP
jgi:AcrR family transcriptional regulator